MPCLRHLRTACFIFYIFYSVSVTVVVKTPSISDLIGANCVPVNGTAVFELSAAKKINATVYNWWCNGSTLSVIPVATQPWKATYNFGPYFTGGSVCVGVNYSKSPYYAQFCKTVTLCPTVKAQMPSSKANIIYPSPSTNAFDFTAGQAIQTAKVFDQLGIEKLNLGLISEGQSVHFGETLPIGVYFLNVQYADKTRAILKVIKVK